MFGSWRRLAVFCCVLLAPAAGYAQDQLHYSKSYTVTGDYVVASVDVSAKDAQGGFVTGTIEVSGVPDNADILAAWLYWETVTSSPQQAAGARFRGNQLTLATRRDQPLNSSASPCFSSGAGTGPYTMSTFTADVLRFLAPQLDQNRIPTGRRLVNGTHQVTLPQGGPGNTVPMSAGASL
jgi:hypothetical protein